MKKLTKEELLKIKEEIIQAIDKIDMAKVREDGEKLDRLIGKRSLTVEDWYRQFTI